MGWDVEGREERALGQFQHSVFGHFVDASRLRPRLRFQTRSEACFSAHDDRIGACWGSCFFGVASVLLAGAYVLGLSDEYLGGRNKGIQGAVQYDRFRYTQTDGKKSAS